GPRRRRRVLPPWDLLSPVIRSPPNARLSAEAMRQCGCSLLCAFSGVFRRETVLLKCRDTRVSIITSSTREQDYVNGIANYRRSTRAGCLPAFCFVSHILI